MLMAEKGTLLRNQEVGWLEQSRALERGGGRRNCAGTPHHLRYRPTKNCRDQDVALSRFKYHGELSKV